MLDNPYLKIISQIVVVTLKGIFVGIFVPKSKVFFVGVLNRLPKKPEYIQLFIFLIFWSVT